VAGFLPGQLGAAEAHAIYASWKQGYVKSDCGDGTHRVEFGSPRGSTVSEGIGYGMLLTAYYGDRAEFDGLWRFTRKHLNANRLLGWKVTCSGFDASVGGAGSATDGDADIALALVAAVDQWGDAYRPAALDYLTAMKAHDFAQCPTSGRTMATNGDWDKGCSASNSSYWTPGYDRVFAEFSHDAFWSAVANDALGLWLADRNSTTGLVANEVNQDGTAARGQDHVDYNGCRIPWRAVLDFLWYGTEAAKTMTDGITDWVDAKDPGHLCDGYATDGTFRPGSRWSGSDCFNGGYAKAAMAKSQDRVDRFTKVLLSLTVDNYYETSLRALYALTLSGNFWRPGSPAVTRTVSRKDVETPAASEPPPRRGGSCSLGFGGDGPEPWLLVPLSLPWYLRRRGLRGGSPRCLRE